MCASVVTCLSADCCDRAELLLKVWLTTDKPTLPMRFKLINKLYCLRQMSSVLRQMSSVLKSIRNEDMLRNNK
jgi:hypothetical protein